MLDWRSGQLCRSEQIVFLLFFFNRRSGLRYSRTPRRQSIFGRQRSNSLGKKRRLAEASGQNLKSQVPDCGHGVLFYFFYLFFFYQEQKKFMTYISKFAWVPDTLRNRYWVDPPPPFIHKNTFLVDFHLFMQSRKQTNRHTTEASVTTNDRFRNLYRIHRSQTAITLLFHQYTVRTYLYNIIVLRKKTTNNRATTIHNTHSSQPGFKYTCEVIKDSHPLVSSDSFNYRLQLYPVSKRRAWVEAEASSIYRSNAYRSKCEMITG